MKYRKKPIVIDAWKWEGKSINDAKKFCAENGLPDFSIGGDGKLAGLVIPTLEGRMIACCGDYVIRGISGEYYPCKSDIFEKSYTLASDEKELFLIPKEALTEVKKIKEIMEANSNLLRLHPPCFGKFMEKPESNCATCVEKTHCKEENLSPKKDEGGYFFIGTEENPACKQKEDFLKAIDDLKKKYPEKFEKLTKGSWEGLGDPEE